MFTLTNGPSAVVHLLQNLIPAINQLKDWYNVMLICRSKIYLNYFIKYFIFSTLVIFGKASNFILFCLCSKHFRRRLFAMAQKKVHERLGNKCVVKRCRTQSTQFLNPITKNASTNE